MKTACLLSLTLLISLSAPAFLLPDDNSQIFDIERLSKRVIVLTERSPMENKIVAIASQKGLVVVDTTGSRITAAVLRKTIEREFGRDDFAFVIDTHHHWDHAWGNQVFSDIEIVGHEGCVPAMNRDAQNIQRYADSMGRNLASLKQRLETLDTDSPEAQQVRLRAAFTERNYEGISEDFVMTPPTRTFDDRLTLDLGDLTLEMIFFGRAHSGDDIFILIPEEGLLLTGDVFLERGWLPLFSGQEELDIPRWIEVLDYALDDARGVTRIIPGHRDIWPKEKLAFWRDYIVELWSGVQAAFKQGISIDETLALLPLDARFDYLKDLGHTDEELGQFQERNIRAFWRQLAESAAERLEALIREKGLEDALAEFNENIRQGNLHYLDESEFNALGYRLLNAGSIEAALAVFTINTEEFHDSWNTWDSLGEAYMTNGDRDKAIENYNRSLSLNPENENAKAILKRLEEGNQ